MKKDTLRCPRIMKAVDGFDDQAFAEPCLTTWLYRHNRYHSIEKTKIRQVSFIKLAG